MIESNTDAMQALWGVGLGFKEGGGEGKLEVKWVKKKKREKNKLACKESKKQKHHHPTVHTPSP